MASNSNKGRRTTPRRQPNQQGRRGGLTQPYEPSPEARRVVEVMSAHGIPQAQISKAITPPCSIQTLRTAFADEIERSRPRYKAMVAQSLHMHLMGRPAEHDAKGNEVRAELKPSVSMAIFQAKVVLGQREQYDGTDDRGRPLVTEEMVAGLNSEEQDQLLRLMVKMDGHTASLVDQNDPESNRYGSLLGAASPESKRAN